MKTRTKIIIALLLGAQALYDGYSFRPTYSHYSLQFMAYMHDRYEAVMNAQMDQENPDEIALAEIKIKADALCQGEGRSVCEALERP